MGEIDLMGAWIRAPANVSSISWEETVVVCGCISVRLDLLFPPAPRRSLPGLLLLSHRLSPGARVFFCALCNVASLAYADRDGDADRRLSIAGWVPLKIICNFPKVKKLSKDIRAIALALERSELLVVAKATRVRRKVRFCCACALRLVRSTACRLTWRAWLCVARWDWDCGRGTPQLVSVARQTIFEGVSFFFFHLCLPLPALWRAPLSSPLSISRSPCASTLTPR